MDRAEPDQTRYCAGLFEPRIFFNVVNDDTLPRCKSAIASAGVWIRSDGRKTL
jgi:hypothetical protein